MRTTIAIIIVCFVIAAVSTVALERRRTSEGGRLVVAALLALYGVCVGIGATLLVYFFEFGEAAAILAGIPLGLPVMYVAAKMGE